MAQLFGMQTWRADQIRGFQVRSRSSNLIDFYWSSTVLLLCTKAAGSPHLSGNLPACGVRMHLLHGLLLQVALLHGPLLAGLVQL